MKQLICCSLFVLVFSTSARAGCVSDYETIVSQVEQIKTGDSKAKIIVQIGDQVEQFRKQHGALVRCQQYLTNLERIQTNAEVSFNVSYLSVKNAGYVVSGEYSDHVMVRCAKDGTTKLVRISADIDCPNKLYSIHSDVFCHRKFVTLDAAARAACK